MRNASRVQSFEKFAGERLARRVGDRVHDAVEPVPLLRERGKQCGYLLVAGDVARKNELAPELPRQLPDALA